MTRTIGYVPVRIGRAVVPVTVEAQQGATTHIDVSFADATITVPDDLEPDAANRAVEQLMPELERQLARKRLN